MANRDGFGLLVLGCAALAIIGVGVEARFHPFSGFFATPVASATCAIECAATPLDLLAQQNMAVAAWAMVVVSAGSLALAVVTILYLKWNLGEARLLRQETARSNTAAEKAAAAATQSTADNRELGEAQIRAYLSVTDVFITLRPTTQLKVRIANTGQSPANTPSVSVQVRVEQALRGTENWVVSESNDAFKALAPIPGGADITPKVQLLPPMVTHDLGEGRNTDHRTRIVVEGETKYVDVFGKWTIEPFRFRRVLFHSHQFQKEAPFERIPESSFGRQPP